VDLRPDGVIRIHMRGPDGTIYPMTGVFQTIVGELRAEAVPHLAGMEQGWAEVLDRLADSLAKDLG